VDAGNRAKMKVHVILTSIADVVMTPCLQSLKRGKIEVGVSPSTNTPCQPENHGH
jgi:hypothetical protein